MNKIDNEGAVQCLIDWFGKMPVVLYVYEQADLVVVAAQHGGCLFFVRLFTVNGFWVVSQDACYYLPDGKHLPTLKLDQQRGNK